MKLKNKILSAIMIVAASMTLVSVSAFAASYSLSPATVEVKAGEEFTVDLVTEDVVDICTIQFYATGTNETFTLTKVEDTALYADPMLATTYGSAEYTLAWSPDGMWENGGVDASGTAAKLTYKVNENVTPGDYTIKVYCDAGLTMDYEENEIDFGTTTATITVKGDEKAEPTVVENTKDSDADANGNVTKGYLVSATVSAETKAINGITVTAASNGKTKSVPYTFTTVTDGTVKVAVNVLNVPSTATVDFSYALSTVAE